ncbi:hypothetical protein [Secundilactobacillus paracollinoides]|nr:hypothetical protein [Secundilactobacillus paracollinoides]KRL77213.1 hypothetical protein FC17_GL001375 [Secundilactobacillus paracollinoides DSM 15502 = JCM 11969]
MQTRRQKTADLSGAIWGLWLILQIFNLLWATIYANAAAGNIDWHYGFIGPWWPFQFLLNYLLFRTINYWICRLLGYHATGTSLIASFTQQRGNAKTTGGRWPQFIRTTTDYKRLYQSQASGLQFIFQLGFIILLPTYAYWAYRWTLFLPGLFGPSKLIFQIIVMAVIGYFLCQAYYRLFPRLFNLKTILVEHGQPIFAHQHTKISQQPSGRGNAQTGGSKFYTTGRVVVQAPDEKE